MWYFFSMTHNLNNGPDRPPVTKYYLELDPPTGDDPVADLDRLLRALVKVGVEDVTVPLFVAAKVPGALKAGGYKVTAAVSAPPLPTLLAVQPGDTTARKLGLAVDLGTTNVVGALVDMITGETLSERSELNPQTAIGEDILTRIHHCLRPGGLEELQACAVSCISSIAEGLAMQAGCAPDDILCVSVAGNTTMAHLLLGLDPYNICRAPYIPVANSFGPVRARDIGLAVAPEAPVFVLPNVGSYVGGDVLAGVLVSGMTAREDISLLVDIGTNAEIVVGNRDWLLVGAGAAGPALEGGVVRFGMRATNGAIDRVVIDPSSFEPSFTVIGGSAPVGLCGSALIDLLAELFTTGLIDGRGRFSDPSKSARIVELDGKYAYVVARLRESGSATDIIFSETDIENLVRTKAAMYTALSVVTRELGVAFSELADFFIAGTFGAYIAADKALAIGMVPDIDLSKYKLLGNSSLTGAVRVLTSTGALQEIGRIARMITYKEMNVSSDFMSEFRAAMFLPHTDEGLFRSAKKRERA